MGNWLDEETKKIRDRSKFGWSKYGRESNGFETFDDEVWTCQTCGEELPIVIPPFLVPFRGSLVDFVKVCPICLFEMKRDQIMDLISWGLEKRGKGPWG